ncbi:hypothetical protein DENSPDRAFT_866389 [Dentipellis sp. KUC8613]|nr:hypothetical protein DENSPDRAFT_866389 [Dentipellis sp. KUC8613]
MPEYMPGVAAPESQDRCSTSQQNFVGDMFGSEYSARDLGFDSGDMPPDVRDDAMDVDATEAGSPIPTRLSRPAYDSTRNVVDKENTNIWAPFRSKLDWSMAYWAKTRGPSSSALSELFKMDDLTERLGLSYRTVTELNEVIDKHLPGRPKFRVEPISIGGEVYDVYFRDVIPCIRALFENPEFTKHLLLAPERQYQDADKTIHAYNEMNTGTWWWSVQSQLKDGATIIPIIISSDKTQLTMFRNKSAYPLYLTIGNIPKDIRRKPSRQAQVLIGYLPTAKLNHITNKTARRRAIGNLFHECLRRILDPIKSDGQEGVAMMSGDGVWRRCHPIFATYVGDYPEQILVTCSLTGDSPKCGTKYDKLGDPSACELRDPDVVQDAFDLADGDPTIFHAACHGQRLRPIFHPFWEGLPYTNIFVSITPDVLHQLYQGVIKHVVSWVTDSKAFGADIIDARCRCMPPNHNARLFSNGITSLSRVSGTEHRDICRILLGLVLDLPLPNGHDPSRLVRAYPMHTNETLDAMDAALQRFHDNRSIFVDLGIRSDFNIPKLHELRHYSTSIKLFGTTDNYNTETWERLHIDLTKNAWRNTNTKDAYPQMTGWVQRTEKMHQHKAFVEWRQAAARPLAASFLNLDPLRHIHLDMTKLPSRRAISFDTLHQKYGAVMFSQALAAFVVSHNEPSLGPVATQRRIRDTLVPQNAVSVFHKIKFWNHDALQREDGQDERDAVHARPNDKDKQGRFLPGRFDTALIKVGDASDRGVTGYRIGQVRTVFTLSRTASELLYSKARPSPPQHLAYVEWFSPFNLLEPDSLTYRVSRSYHDEDREASIIPIVHIHRSVQLWPLFGPGAPPANWTSYNVLEECEMFRVNPFLDRHTYMTVY